ncbi:MAG TPA: SDR family oxidoreductase [Gaiellaceae bacterium]|nr:SDR family oxidoreductase [Gaiellaceae bacterium]
MKGIEGKVAVIAGGATTFGEAVAGAFVDAGASVTIADVAESGIDVAESLGERALFCRTDVTEDAAIEGAVAATVDRFGGIDFLVNMAATYLDRGIETSREEWLQALSVNVVGTARFVSAVAPHLKARGGGAIVNFASVGGKAARVGRWTYPTSKAALLQLTRCQAADLAPDGIRVNSVSPAWTWSRPLREAAGDDRERARRYAAPLHVMRRFAEPREIAEAVLFLCSDHASFVTATDLACDGGNSALGPEGLTTPLAVLARDRS